MPSSRPTPIRLRLFVTQGYPSVDFPGAFEIVLTAYDQVENGTSLEAVQHTLAELICFDPHHEIVEELRWKRTDLIVEKAHSIRDASRVHSSGPAATGK